MIIIRRHTGVARILPLITLLTLMLTPAAVLRLHPAKQTRSAPKLS